MASELHQFQSLVQVNETEVRNALKESSEGTVALKLYGMALMSGALELVMLTLSPETSKLIQQIFWKDEFRAERIFSERHAEEVRQRLDELDVWTMQDNIEMVIDGWIGVITIGTGDRIHSIRMHSPQNPAHRRLLDYIEDISPIDPRTIRKKYNRRNMPSG